MKDVFHLIENDLRIFARTFSTCMIRMRFMFLLICDKYIYIDDKYVSFPFA